MPQRQVSDQSRCDPEPARMGRRRTGEDGDVLGVEALGDPDRSEAEPLAGLGLDDDRRRIVDLPRQCVEPEFRELIPLGLQGPISGPRRCVHSANLSSGRAEC